MKPQTKTTTYTQSNDSVLPTLDPTQQDVAKPFEPTNKSGSEAAEYLSPDSGQAAPMSADEVRSAANASKDVDGRVTVEPDPGLLSKISDTIKSVQEDNEPDAFVDAEGKKRKPTLSEEFLTTDPNAVYRNVKEYTDFQDGKPNPKFNKIANRLDEAFGTPGASQSLTGSTKDKLIKAVEIYGGNGLGMNLNDTSRLLDSSNYSDAKSITNLISRVTEDGEILDCIDLGGQLAMIHGLSEQLIRWGVPEYIDMLIEKLNDDKEKEKAYEELCIRAAAQGDLDSVEYFAGKMDSGRRFAIWERVVSKLIARFYIRRDETRSHKQLGEKLVSVLSSFNSNWDRDATNQSITNLYYYTIASIESEMVIRQTSRRIHAIAGRHIRIEHPWTTITRNFSDLN